MKPSRLILSLLLNTFYVPLAFAQSASVDALGVLPSELSSVAYAISGDGLTVVGSSNSKAYRWTDDDGMVALGTLGGASEARAVGNNGTVVGQSNNLAFRWTQGGGMVSLGTLGGATSDARGISDDGSVIVGVSSNGLQNRAFRWTQGGGMVSLGTAVGVGSSSAFGVSGDGLTVVGYSNNSDGFLEAMRWTQGGGMQLIGISSTVNSEAHDASYDGSVIVGKSGTMAFRWTQGTGMVNIGSLGGASEAKAVSGDGLIIVGNSNGDAFLWNQDDGIKSIEQILIDGGINMTGWNLISANGISSDGTRVVGQGNYNGVLQSYIYTAAGLITPEELAQSVAPVAQQVQQVQSAVNDGVSQTMFTARNAITSYFPRIRSDIVPYSQSNPFASGQILNSDITPAAGGPRVTDRGYRRAFYALGNYGVGQDNEFANDNVSGTAGLLVEVSDYLALGIGGVGNISNIETHLDGHNRSDAWGGNVLAAYEPPNGLRFYGTVTASALNVETRRHYMNGGGIDGSKGETDGIGYGAALRGGYEMPVTEETSFMPYMEWQVSHTRLDGYTETGGGFPTMVEEQENTYVTSRLGGEISHDLSDNMIIRGRAAWGHRYSESDPTVATTIGITQIIPGSDGDRDWAEAGMTLNYKLSDRTTFTADLSGRAGKTAEPAVNATLGLVVRW